MVNNDIINNIRKNTKMSFNKKIFDFFMDKYFDQDMSTYSSKEGEALFDFIRLNSSNASKLNEKDYKELLMILINRSIIVARYNGIDLTTNELTAKLLTGLKRREGRLTFDSEELFGNKIGGEKNIFFYIDIDGENIVGLVKEIISQMDSKGIAYDITIPNSDEIIKGHTDAIVISASPESYMLTVEALENVSQEKKDKVKDNDYARDNWFGINTVVNGVPADVMLGKLFIQGINEILKEAAVKYSYLDIEGKSIVEFMDTEINKDKTRQLAYNSLIKLDSSLDDRIFNRILELIDSKGLNINNMYVYDIVNDELDKLYGKIESNNDEIVLDETPETVNVSSSSEINDSNEAVDKTTEQLKNEKVEDVNVSQVDTITPLSMDEKKSITAAIDETQENLEKENKYLGLLDGVEDWSFASTVRDENGNAITLLDFLDRNNTLNKIPLESVVTLLDTTTIDGVSVSGKKFISKYVLDSLRLNNENQVSPNGLTLDEIMEKYVEKVEDPELGITYPEGLTAPSKSKANFLKKLFKGR